MTTTPDARLPDGWHDAYRWLLRMTPSTDTAEDLTVEVCRRMRSGRPAWLTARALDTRLRFFVVQVLLERRGILGQGVGGPAGRHGAADAESAAAEVRPARYPTVVEEVGPRRPEGNDERAGGMRGVRVAEILAALTASGPTDSWAARLVGNCQAATRMSGVGLAVTGPDGLAAVFATTGDHARRMEDLQFALGEGPGLDATRSGRPVLVSDLTAQASRWPVFTPEATGVGVHAAFTFPLQVGAIGIGVLDLYRTTPGDLDAVQFGQALAFADAAVAVLLHLQDRAGSDVGGGGADGASPTPTADAGTDVIRAVDRRAVVHQATGMISVQLDVSLAVALSRLRAHAYAAGGRILDVAADVVSRRLEFDDSDAGTRPPPPGRRPQEIGGEESP